MATGAAKDTGFSAQIDQEALKYLRQIGANIKYTLIKGMRTAIRKKVQPTLASKVYDSGINRRSGKLGRAFGASKAASIKADKARQVVVGRVIPRHAGWAALESGATIHHSKAKWLYIPLRKSRKGPRDFGGLFMLATKSGRGRLVLNRSMTVRWSKAGRSGAKVGTERKRVTPLFIAEKSVVIRGRKYVERAGSGIDVTPEFRAAIDADIKKMEAKLAAKGKAT